MPALKKNSNTGELLGVCAGIAEWRGWSPHKVRICMAIVGMCSFGLVWGFYLFLAGILTDEAECT
jgi:phage shock protein PspC (stress-responsive transcriptional regulator)